MEADDPFVLFMGPPEQENLTKEPEARQNSTSNRHEQSPTPPKETRDQHSSSNASSGPPITTPRRGAQLNIPSSQNSAKSDKSKHTPPTTPNSEDETAEGDAKTQEKPPSNHSDLPQQIERREPSTTGRPKQQPTRPKPSPENNITKPTQRTEPRKEHSLTSRLSTALSSIVNRGLQSMYTPSKKRTIRIPRRYLD